MINTKERGRLDEMEDFDVAVSAFIHKGRSKDEVVDILQDRGADESQIKEVFEFIDENYSGPRRFQCSAKVRMVNFIVDITLIIVLFFLCMIELSKYNTGTWAYTSVFIVPLIYYLIFEGIFARTPGKFLTGSIVVDLEGKKPNFWLVLVRTFCRLHIKAILHATDSSKVFHDEMSDTCVVNKRRWEKEYQVV